MDFGNTAPVNAMEFSSLVFIFLYLPILLLLFYISPKKLRNPFLLLASLLFYTWGEGKFALILLGSTTVNYLLGLAVDRLADGKGRKGIFILALFLNIGFLLYFKYTHFFLDGVLSADFTKTIHLPLGISFFTFQALSFLIDIYRRTQPMDRNAVHFGLYMTYFPKLVMGPIMPYHNLAKQIKAPNLCVDDVSEGVKRFVMGLGKKVLIADTVARTANHIFSIPAQHQTLALTWLGAISFGLQIYFDFSGYTDMAVGIARMCGFKFVENFNHPYIASSIKDFWARWHISLAHWLRDYLFLPIAYWTLRRIKQERLLTIKAENWAYFIAALTTFTLCGLWHGAAWTFVIWGALYGVLLVIEHAGLRKFMKKKCKKIPFVKVLYTQFFVLVGWVFFRSPGVEYALGYLKAMFGMGQGTGDIYYPALYLDNEVIFMTIIALAGCFPLFSFLKKGYLSLTRRLEENRSHTALGLVNFGYGLVYNLYLLLIMLAGTLTLVSGTYNPFIYARF